MHSAVINSKYFFPVWEQHVPKPVSVMSLDHTHVRSSFCVFIGCLLCRISVSHIIYFTAIEFHKIFLHVPSKIAYVCNNFVTQVTPSPVF